ncbi:MAG: hypothetical protein IJJ48_01265 [Firmicutes bacterium]|nr:hypothetical protein [Bacillota bacterium]
MKIENLDLNDVIKYAGFAAGHQELFDERREEPTFVDMDSINENSSYLEIWKALLGDHYKEEKDSESYRLLLKLENYDDIDADDVVSMDGLIGKEYTSLCSRLSA